MVVNVSSLNRGYFFRVCVWGGVEYVYCKCDECDDGINGVDVVSNGKGIYIKRLGKFFRR